MRLEDGEILEVSHEREHDLAAHIGDLKFPYDQTQIFHRARSAKAV